MTFYQYYISIKIRKAKEPLQKTGVAPSRWSSFDNA